MDFMYYVVSVVLMGICFCIGALTEKHFADEEIKMLKTRKMRPANIKIEKHIAVKEYTVSDKALDVDFPTVEKVR